MRCFFIFTICSFVCFNLVAQKHKKDDDVFVVFTKVEINAVTDFKAWNSYLKKATILSESAVAGIPAGTYKVNVQFIIDTYGNIAEVKATNRPGYGLAQKAEKIISGYEGIWQPANQCGRNVKSYKEQIVEFVVPDRK